jgi:hypothetical protein
MNSLITAVNSMQYKNVCKELIVLAGLGLKMGVKGEWAGIDGVGGLW